MDNISLFNYVTASVLRLLYENFPNPIMLDTGKLRVEFGISDEDWHEYRGGGNSIGSDIRWLGDEGFVRYASEAGRGTAFASAVLTAKGLSALNRSPDVLTPKPTIGERLKEVGKTAATETITSLVKAALGVSG